VNSGTNRARRKFFFLNSGFEQRTQNHALEPFAALEGKLREGSYLITAAL